MYISKRYAVILRCDRHSVNLDADSGRDILHKTVQTLIFNHHLRRICTQELDHGGVIPAWEKFDEGTRLRIQTFEFELPLTG